MSEVDKKRILKELKAYGLFATDAQFAKFLGISPQHLAVWYKRNTFNTKLISEKFPDVSMYWLLTGDGEMFGTKSDIKTGVIKINKDGEQVMESSSGDERYVSRERYDKLRNKYQQFSHELW